VANWKEIKGYEEMYLISDEGEIISLPRIVKNGQGQYQTKEKTLKQGKRGRDGSKYAFVILNKNGVSKHYSVHRLVAEAFVDNPNNYPKVNHKDENPLNNNVSNLEWCDRQYNIEYSKNKAVQQFSVDGELIAEYKSISYASAITGISRTAINNVLKEWSYTAGGYIWKYSNNKRSDDLSHSQGKH